MMQAGGLSCLIYSRAGCYCLKVLWRNLEISKYGQPELGMPFVPTIFTISFPTTETQSFSSLFAFFLVMFALSRLPIDVYHVIHQYLLNYDYHEFLNTSKAVFSEVKYRTMHYHLRCRDPFFHVDAEIISNVVTSKVMNKSAQIFITFTFDSRFYQASVVNSARLNLHIPIDVHTLKLQHCYHSNNLCFTGMEGGYLNTLEIYGGHGNDVEYDFSSISVTFPFLQKLVVADCRTGSVIPLLYIPYIKLTDVVLPGNLSSRFQDVNLHQTSFHYDVHYERSPPLISTLSAFKDVQDLFLKGEFDSSNSAPGYSLSCQSITLINVKAQSCFPLHLRTPKRLSLSYLDLKLLMIDDITDLEELSLCKCSNVDMTLFRNAKIIKFVLISSTIDFINPVTISDLISLQFLSHIKLNRCDIVEVSLFRNVRSVELALCTKLTSLEGLGKSAGRGKGNHHVLVADCHGISDFSPLNGVYRVNIQSCSGFTDGYQVKDVNNLEIYFCDKIQSFHMFGKVYSLRMCGCNHLVTLFGFQDIPYLDISYCRNLKDIEGLKNNQYVEIRDCRLISCKREYYENLYSFFPHFSITSKYVT
jgi:hypothetical protein